MYLETEPYDHGLLDVGDGQLMYWEVCGNPDGKPAVVFHGGPGSGAGAFWRRFFDPAKYRVVLFDQRGCGRSTPDAALPDADLSTNTTWHLVADIERLREHLGIEKWLILGASWGATLAFAYAETHPAAVSEIVLFSVTSSTPREVKWITRDMGRIFPAEWTRFRDVVPVEERDGNLALAYSRLLHDPDPAVRDRAARAWCEWRTPMWRRTTATGPTRATRTRSSGCGSRAWCRTTGVTSAGSKTAPYSATPASWQESPAS